MRRNLNRVCEYFESTIPQYFPDEFKSHFQMGKETCELFICKAMPAERISLGNGSGRAAISPRKQVLAFVTLKLLSGSHVDRLSIHAS